MIYKITQFYLFLNKKHPPFVRGGLPFPRGGSYPSRLARGSLFLFYFKIWGKIIILQEFH
jgi:hypothetical protein